MVAAKGSLTDDGFEPFLKAFEALTGRKPTVDLAKFKEIVSPEHFVAVRARFGGPAPEPMGEALNSYRDRLAAFEEQARKAAEKEAAAAAELQEKFTALMGAR
ncbi:Uncharacterised protein [Mycobacterium tuberculosis]|nr:Uncharacterised protein [Mycobacterium tuberculosis]